jgi:hypothetical protein
MSSTVGALLLFCFPPQDFLPLQNHVTPASFLIVSVLAYASVENLHPAFLVGRSIGIEVDNLPVIEADSESLFNEHIAFFLFSKARLATLATLPTRLLLGESPTIINELRSIRQIDRCTWLAS